MDLEITVESDTSPVNFGDGLGFYGDIAPMVLGPTDWQIGQEPDGQSCHRKRFTALARGHYGSRTRVSWEKEYY
jgi:hypothetical protein